jgi:hypothetical protein
MEPPRLREFERFTLGGFSFFPDLSSFGSPPAEPVVYLKEIITFSCSLLPRVIMRRTLRRTLPAFGHPARRGLSARALMGVVTAIYDVASDTEFLARIFHPALEELEVFENLTVADQFKILVAV